MGSFMFAMYGGPEHRPMRCAHAELQSSFSIVARHETSRSYLEQIAHFHSQYDLLQVFTTCAAALDVPRKPRKVMFASLSKA